MSLYISVNSRITTHTDVRLCILATIICWLAAFSLANPLVFGEPIAPGLLTYATNHQACRYRLLLMPGNGAEWFLDAEPLWNRINSCSVKFKATRQTRKLDSITLEDLHGAIVSCGDVTSCVEKIDIPAADISHASNHGRKLLGLQTEVPSDGLPYTTVIAVTSVGLLLFVFVLILCTCNKSSDTDSVRTDPEHDPSAEQQQAEAGVIQVVDTAVTPMKTDQNGVVAPAELSSSKQLGHDHRELPELPHATPGPILPPDVREDINAEHEYDHLHRVKNIPTRRTDYDHVDINDVNATGVEPVIKVMSPVNTYNDVKSENIYAGIKGDEEVTNEGSVDGNTKGSGNVERKSGAENLYAKVNGDKTADNCTSDKLTDNDNQQTRPFNHYIRVNDNEPYAIMEDVDIDPYNKVRDDTYDKTKDDPYNSVKDNPYKAQDGLFIDDPYNKMTDDPYNMLSDDTYNKVSDVDPYNNVADEPYSGVIDDPYNVVKDNDGESAGQVNKAAILGIQSEEIDDHYSVVDPRKKIRNRTASDNDESTQAKGPNGEGAAGFHLRDVTDEYATVVKTRSNDSACAAVGNGLTASVNRESNPYSLPPEPPRQYGTEDIMRAENDVPTVILQQGPLQSEPLTGTGREPRYTKVSARESLASVYARQALNTYEVVLDTENTYATVEGGSGDGIVKQIPPAGSVSPGQLGRDISDTYMEIGSAAAAAPAPPSIDSLQQVSRQKSYGPSPLAEPEVFESDDYATVDKFPPMSPKSPISPAAQRDSNISNSESFPPSPGVQNGEVDGVVLNPNYQSVQDCVTENDSDPDPNYESVDEAKSKSPCSDNSINDNAVQFTTFKPNLTTRPLRGHVYEEVRPSEERLVRDRVLRHHTYEEIIEVKQQKEELSRKSAEFSEKL